MGILSVPILFLIGSVIIVRLNLLPPETHEVKITNVYCPFRVSIPQSWQYVNEVFVPVRPTSAAKITLETESAHRSLGRDPAKGYFLTFEELCMLENRGTESTADGKKATLQLAFCEKNERRPKAVYQYLAIVEEPHAYNFLRVESQDRQLVKASANDVKYAIGTYTSLESCAERLK